MKWPRWGWPKPQIPVQSSGHRLHFRRALCNPDDVTMPFCVGLALPSPGARDPNMRLRDWTNRAALKEFHRAMIIFVSVNLNAHLRCHFSFRRRFTNLARLPDVVRERFFAIDMLAM